MQFDKYLLLIIFLLLPFIFFGVIYGDPRSLTDDNFFDLDSMHMVHFLQLTLGRKHTGPVKHLSISVLVVIWLAFLL